MATHNEAWYDDPTSWVALGFVIFAGLFFRYLLPMLNSALDKRSENIRGQLEQASRLRAEAEEVLENFKARQEEMEIEALRIVEEAKQEAKAMREQAKEDLVQMLARRNEQAEAKIAKMEQDAAAEIRQKIALIANDAALELIQENLNADQQNNLAQKALQSLDEKIAS